MLLTPFQIVIHLTLFTETFTTRLIQKIVHNFIFFVLICLINKYFLN